MRHRDEEGRGRRGRDDRGAGRTHAGGHVPGVRGARRGPVRVLHPGHRDACEQPARVEPRPGRSRDPEVAQPAPLPVHRVPEDRRGHTGGGQGPAQWRPAREQRAHGPGGHTAPEVRHAGCRARVPAVRRRHAARRDAARGAAAERSSEGQGALDRHRQGGGAGWCRAGVPGGGCARAAFGGADRAGLAGARRRGRDHALRRRRPRVRRGGDEGDRPGEAAELIRDRVRGAGARHRHVRPGAQAGLPRRSTRIPGTCCQHLRRAKKGDVDEAAFAECAHVAGADLRDAVRIEHGVPGAGGRARPVPCRRRRSGSTRRARGSTRTGARSRCLLEPRGGAAVDRGARAQRGRLRRQGGPLRPGARRAHGAPARPDGEPGDLARRVDPDAPQAAPDPHMDYDARLRRGGEAARAASPDRRRHGRVRVGRHEGARAGVRARDGGVRRAQRGYRVHGGVHEQPAVRRDARIRGEPGGVRDGVRAR